MRSMGASGDRGVSGSRSVGDAGGAVLVDEVAGLEALEGEGPVDLVRLVGRDGVGEGEAGAGRGLEPAGAPAAVDVELVHLGPRDDRGGVGGDVDDPAPGAQHAGPREDREELDGGRELVLDDMEGAALPVAVVLVHARAHHELSLVRLGAVHVHVVAHHDGRVDGLEQLADQGLQRAGLDGQAHPGGLGDLGGVPGRGERDLAGIDPTAGGLDADGTAVLDDHAGDLAVLDDVHAQLIGLARQGPGDVVVLGDAGAGLVGRPEHRIADVLGGVQDRHDLLDLLGVEPFGVHAVEPVGVDAAHGAAHVAEGVVEVEHAALAEQEVVLELLGQLLPQLQGGLVDHRGLVPEVVRADDRGVAGHVAAGQPTALEHGDVRDAVAGGEVVGGGETVAASADDHDVVARGRIGRVPQEIGVLGEKVGHGGFLRRGGRALPTVGAVPDGLCVDQSPVTDISLLAHSRVGCRRCQHGPTTTHEVPAREEETA
jgi:hypothetical protein